jgi:hypothetical protein
MSCGPCEEVAIKSGTRSASASHGPFPAYISRSEARGICWKAYDALSAGHTAQVTQPVAAFGFEN